QPGLTLRRTAQDDLRCYIKELIDPCRQVDSSTHSRFMVDLENIGHVRTVEDVVIGTRIEGTKVSEDFLRTEPDTFFPLQAALGYEITQTLFIGKHALLVEGPADLLYVQWFPK